VRSGRYERIRRGLYRLRDYPGSTHEEVREKWLAVGAERAVVSHESALELHGLSDVLPNTVHLLVQRGDRGLKPHRGVTLHTATATIEPAEVVTREGIRVTAPARSIVDAASAGTAPEQIESAIAQALDEGLVTPRSLLAQLGRREGGRVGQLVRRAVGEGGSS
jgi:predicted transcriptional regulator of viral defense system